ncbi:MAG TPA: hypothetical protein VGC44_13010, partial [Longimicrobiales bacterium]
FIGKVYILSAAVENNLVPLAVVLVLASLVSYWYYLRMAWYMWFREPVAPAEGSEPIVLNGAMKFALVSAAILVVVLGVLPNVLLDAAAKSAASLSVDATSLGMRR